jgi:protein NEDD1
MASAHDNGSIIIWDVSTQTKKCELNGHLGAPCTGIAFSPVNNLLLSSCGLDGRIQFFDIKSEKQVKTIENLQNPMSSIAFCFDGHTIAVGSLKGRIYVYDLKDKQRIKIELKGQETKKINCI